MIAWSALSHSKAFGGNAAASVWSQCTHAAEVGGSTEASVLCLYADLTCWHLTAWEQWVPPAPELGAGSSLSPPFKMQVNSELLFHITNYIEGRWKVTKQNTLKLEKYQVKHQNKDCPTILIHPCIYALSTVSNYLLMIHFGSTQGMTESIFRSVWPCLTHAMKLQRWV